MTARLNIGADLADWPALARFVEDFAVSQALPAAERSRLLILLEELLTNLAKYGYEPGDRHGRAEIGLALDRGRLTIDFEDDGRAFDPLGQAADHLDRAVEDRPVGGLGLHLIRSMVDEASYSRRSGRNHLRLVRRLTAG